MYTSLFLFMNSPNKQSTEYSDSKYLLILFALIFIVLFFVFLIYFIYGQKQFATETMSQEVKNIEEMRHTNNLTTKPTIPLATV